ncbi:MAG: 1-(5-phosphoribosyl)-5-[(5-phosphoribosylamino)methylideneamino]imidazole-4-carboxamide isomerase [Gammaproteobacteria bacterium]|nr:1-(5-phosphoribosyl)-5-[(5-phosphoribosylamino)methylideneamino]imidazole-4-carboxamide isomerase [Gammaproteobacteria bacterium]
MNIIPAIDLKAGQCVRLTSGQFDQITHYSDDPVDVARQYEQAGATDLHVVDLDGACQGTVAQLPQLLAIREATSLTIQIGGGVRQQETIETLLSAGIDRVVIGSLAVKDIEQTKMLLQRFGQDKLVLAFDVKIDRDNVPVAATHGWQVNSEKSLWSLLDQYSEVNLQRVLCTDIHKDGTLMGPNIELYRQCVLRYPNLSIQASGGIAQLEDFSALARAGAAAAIVGKALFENRFSYADAIAVTAPC